MTEPESNVQVDPPNDAGPAPQPDPGGAAALGPAERAAAFLRRLREAYARRDGLAEARGERADGARVDALTVAAGALASVEPQTPPQVAVLGPTQAGKSTVVNLLLDRAAAGVSPLAGFTVHPQAFVVGSEAAGSQDAAGIAADWFPGWQRRRVTDLAREDYAQFAVEPIERAPNDWTGPAAFVAWDTPDFDSLAAPAYRHGVLEVAARAHAHLVVLSREKYADLAVWRLLTLLAPLQRPTVIVLNKMTAEARGAIEAALRERLAALGGACGAWRIVALPFDGQLATAGSSVDAVRELRTAVAEALQADAGAARRRGVRTFVEGQRANWLGPLEAEHAAAEAWRAAVDDASAWALRLYRAEYLDHPDRFEAFRQAIEELLSLLEIPGTADVLGRFRRVVTWPARQLFAWRQARGASGAARGGSEELVLDGALERTVTALARDAAGRASAGGPGWGVWAALGRALEQREPAIRAEFRAAAVQQRTAFRSEVTAAAEQLFAVLRERPALLNSLRAVRSTMDATAIVVALKTGGLTPEGLVLAPALVGVTSMLTEGALGSYMTRVADDLKRRQFEAVRSALFDGTLQPALGGLADGLRGPELLGVSAAELAGFENDWRAWRAQHA